LDPVWLLHELLDLFHSPVRVPASSSEEKAMNSKAQECSMAAQTG
jgi:hypothetical protein